MPVEARFGVIKHENPKRWSSSTARWPELAADRLAWQTMLRDGAPPPTFRKPPPPAVPMPISHFLVRPRRRAAEKTNAAIDASVRELAGVSRLGIVKKKRNK